MEDDQFLAVVKKAVATWSNEHLQGECQDSMDPEDALFDMLCNLGSARAPSNVNADTGGPSPSKKPKVSADVKKTPAGDKKITPSRTLKELALLILDNCQENENEDLKTLEVFKKSGTPINLNNGSPKSFKDKINQCDNDAICVVVFKNSCWRDNDVDKAYLDMKRQFSPLEKLRGALKDLFESSSVLDPGKILPWDSDLVAYTGGDFTFPVELEKGRAIVITGESGSGKSWFAKKFLPTKHPDASFIYHELGDEDANFDSCSYSPEDDFLAYSYQRALKCLTLKGWLDTPVYRAVSELSRKNNQVRNTAAKKKFNELMKKTVMSNDTVCEWWQQNPNNYKLEKLVIIIDEAGKAPELARGLVDEVRQISCDISNKGLAKCVMLVLVGSGLDHHIDEDSLDFKGCATERAVYTRFGTDPSKSELTVLKGPNLNSGGKIHGIPISDINEGKYSQVLATNTRMLARGIIPIFESSLNTLRVDNLSERRIELGSTNVVMDYAARVYIELNGLSRLHTRRKKHYEALLLSQFRLLFYFAIRKLKDVDGKPAFHCPFSVSLDEYQYVLSFGLIATDVVSTSPALRYLACKGQTAPLDAQDGVAFEIVIQHHLVRLCRAQNDARSRNDEQRNQDYFCGRYSLAQAWPPSSTRRAGLTNEADVTNEVHARYENEETKIRSKEDEEDAEKIAKLLRDKREYDLVLRQTVPNVQGADVLVLSKRAANGHGGTVTLDLYQAMHYNKIPSLRSAETIGAFASLGVHYDAAQGSFDTEPKTCSAGYSCLGTLKFADELSRTLGVKVKVRKCVVVFSKSWEALQKSTSWKEFDFEAARKKNVFIWAKDMLEPTVSAIVTVPAMKINDDVPPVSQAFYHAQ